MAKPETITISERDVMAQCDVVVELKYRPSWRFRVGLWLMRQGVWLTGARRIKFEFDGTEWKQ